MRRILSAASLALPLTAATLGAGSAHAQDDSFTERAVVSCLSGATVSGLTSGLVLMPLVNSGIGTSVAVSAVALSAGVGCGAGLAFTTASTGYSWVYRNVTKAPAEATSAPSPAMRERTTPNPMLHAAR
ncbi:hypothetical protein [Azospirillum agricola]|uniref:hypothetical protein n=1 Tax=Azospirillum agricola TaxID=1720247 RepID=UPI000A0F2A0C|nr:hypothetical protein [Azospirillum agricola]SMH60514.1 hypothetical protein SAMN02982994_5548 [Azospirillum lipoferum]